MTPIRFTAISTLFVPGQGIVIVGLSEAGQIWQRFSGQWEAIDNPIAEKFINPSPTPILLPPPPPVPAPPAKLQASLVGKTAVTLTWVNVGGSPPTAFEVERSVDGAGFSQIATTVPSILTFTDLQLTVGMSVEYMVRAINDGGASEYSNATSPILMV